MNDEGTQPLVSDDLVAPSGDPYIGMSVDGRYLIESKLGQGGMGVVYAGRHKVIDKRVAIKILHGAMAQNQDVTARFLQEAKTASSIGNPHIVDVSDFGTLEDGSTYLVMEHVAGSTLTELMREVRPFPLTRILAITKQIATGLGAAHEAGIVHRDLKPDNVMIVHRSAPGLTGSGRDFVKILDFGIAKVVGQVTGRTKQGAIFGTPHYMSPEQASGTTVDRRTDIYALGVILYEMACGERPFDAENFMALLNMHIRADAVPLLQRPHPPSVPRAYEAMVQKCLAKKADDRYASMDELLGDLDKLEHGDPASSRAGAPPLSAPDLAAPDVSAIPDLLIPDLAPRPSTPKVTAAAGAPASKPRAAMAPPMGGGDDGPFQDAGPSLMLEVDGPMANPHVSMAGMAPRISRAGSLDARGGRDEPIRRSRPASGRGGRALLALLAATAATVVFGGPPLLKTLAVQSAARRGLVLAVERVEVRGSGLALLAVTLSPTSLPGCTLRAPEADVTMDWQGNVQKVSVPGYELALRGRASDVGERFAAWRKEAHVPTAIEAKAGHLTWPDALLPKVDLDALDVSMTLAGDEEATLHMEASSMSVKVPRGPLGPWRAQLDSSTAETKLVLSLDRSHASGPPTVTLTSRPDLGRVLSIVVPRGKLDDIGVPTEALRLPKDAEVKALFEGQVLPTGQPVNAKAKVTLFKWPLSNGSGVGATTPLDLTIEGRVGGDSTEPLRMDDGVVTLGKASSTVTGTVLLAADGARVQIEHPHGKGPTSPPLVFDTRAFTQ